MDTVFIEALAIECTIGIHEWERGITQPVLLDIEIGFDNRKPASSDALVDTLDYSAVAEACTRIAVEGRFGLVETLVERVAEWTLRQADVLAVTVTCRKPGAIPAARCAGVRIRRRREP